MTLWTDERATAVTVLWNAGQSAGLIAGVLGITRNMVIGKVRRLGLVARETTADGRSRPERKTRFYARKEIRRAIEKPADMPTGPLNGIGVSFMELTADTCRFPIGDPLDSSFFFCGQPPRDGSPYCWHCHGVAYQPHVASRRTYIPARRTPA